MSLLVRYTLKSATDHDHQTTAMTTLVADLKSQSIPVHYSCFTTANPTKFLGVLEFDTEADFKAFQASAAFATYKATVGPTFANPPETEQIASIATTRA